MFANTVISPTTSTWNLVVFSHACQWWLTFFSVRISYPSICCSINQVSRNKVTFWRLHKIHCRENACTCTAIYEKPLWFSSKIVFFVLQMKSINVMELKKSGNYMKFSFRGNIMLYLKMTLIGGEQGIGFPGWAGQESPLNSSALGMMAPRSVRLAAELWGLRGLSNSLFPIKSQDTVFSSSVRKFPIKSRYQRQAHQWGKQKQDTADLTNNMLKAC